MLKETSFLGSKPKDTLIKTNYKIGCVKREGLINKGRYQRQVRCQNNLSHTRSNIIYVASVVSHFIHEPYEEHLEVFSNMSKVYSRRDYSFEEMSWGKLKPS